MMSLALSLHSDYSIPTVETTAVGFDSLNRQRRMHRRFTSGFFVSACLSAPLWVGYGGEGCGPAGFLCHQSVNPAVCPPTSFDSGERVNPDIGGHIMAGSAISARPEQTLSSFPLAARAARKAARQWFAGIPTQSLAVWRDERCKAHCDRLPLVSMRSRAFNDAFAREIAQLMIGGAA